MRARLCSTTVCEKCVLGVSQLGGEPDQTSEAPFQDSGVFIRGEPPNKKTTRQRTKQDLDFGEDLAVVVIAHYWNEF